MAQRIRTKNALIWVGIGIVVIVVWALAVVGAISLWSGLRDDTAAGATPPPPEIARAKGPLTGAKSVWRATRYIT